MTTLPEDRQSLGIWSRLLLVMTGCLLVAGFAVALQLQPDPRGYGTHRQLGAGPCVIRTVTGVPCPVCGLTTSFACSVRINWGGAVRAHPAGPLLAGCCLILIPWSWISAWTGRIQWVSPSPWSLVALLCGLSILTTAGWLLRLAGLA